MTTSDAPGALSPLKRAFIALEQAEARLAAVEHAAREPIAVIGLGCRVPGADDPAAFWRLLESGGDAVLPVPPERWEAAMIALGVASSRNADIPAAAARTLCDRRNRPEGLTKLPDECRSFYELVKMAKLAEIG